MAKPLGEKSKVIRQAIEANDSLGNAEIAALLNGHEDRKRDKLAFKAADVGNQRVALRKTSGASGEEEEETRQARRREGRDAPRQRSPCPPRPAPSS